MSLQSTLPRTGIMENQYLSGCHLLYLMNWLQKVIEVELVLRHLFLSNFCLFSSLLLLPLPKTRYLFTENTVSRHTCGMERSISIQLFRRCPEAWWALLQRYEWKSGTAVVSSNGQLLTVKGSETFIKFTRTWFHLHPDDSWIDNDNVSSSWPAVILSISFSSSVRLIAERPTAFSANNSKS